MDILMSETCWAHKWNKNSKWHQVGLLFSTITMMHGPINIRCCIVLLHIMFVAWTVCIRHILSLHDSHTDLSLWNIPLSGHAATPIGHIL